jgi:anti-sigma factor RsiW
MDCQKKSKQIMERSNDFALDELNPNTEFELLAHLAECEACRESYNHARAVRTAVDRSAQRLAVAEPSPEFMAKLRARIASEPAPRRWNWGAETLWQQRFRRPLSYAAVALVVASILVVVMIQPSRRDSAPPMTRVSGPSSSLSVPARPAVVIANRSKNPEHLRTEVAPGSVPSDRFRREPEVLVPRAELLVVAQFYEATRRSRVDTHQIYAAQLPMQGPIEVKPIEIQPLELLDASAAVLDSGSNLR